MFKINIGKYRITIDAMYHSVVVWYDRKLFYQYQTKKGKKLSYYTSLFRTFFEGCYGNDPIIPQPVSSFRIRKFQLKNKTLKIWLERPGLVVGKSGSTIDKLKEFLQCEVELVECSIFGPYIH